MWRWDGDWTPDWEVGGLCRGYSECGVFVSCWNYPASPGLGSLNVLSVATCLNLEPLAGSGQGQGVGRQIMAAVPGP